MVHRDALGAAQAKIAALEQQLADLRSHARGEEADRLGQLRNECERLRRELEESRVSTIALSEAKEAVEAQVAELQARLDAAGPPQPYDGEAPLLRVWNRAQGGLKLPELSAPTNVQCAHCATLDETALMRTLPMSVGNGQMVVCPRCGNVGMMVNNSHGHE
jgi:hypothetical protein